MRTLPLITTTLLAFTVLAPKAAHAGPIIKENFEINAYDDALPSAVLNMDGYSHGVVCSLDTGRVSYDCLAVTLADDAGFTSYLMVDTGCTSGALCEDGYTVAMKIEHDVYAEALSIESTIYVANQRANRLLNMGDVTTAITFDEDDNPLVDIELVYDSNWMLVCEGFIPPWYVDSDNDGIPDFLEDNDIEPEEFSTSEVLKITIAGGILGAAPTVGIGAPAGMSIGFVVGVLTEVIDDAINPGNDDETSE